MAVVPGLVPGIHAFGLEAIRQYMDENFERDIRYRMETPHFDDRGTFRLREASPGEPPVGGSR